MEEAEETVKQAVGSEKTIEEKRRKKKGCEDGPGRGVVVEGKVDRGEGEGDHAEQRQFEAPGEGGGGVVLRLKGGLAGDVDAVGRFGCGGLGGRHEHWS
jgi:hypothetical protein